MRKGWVCTGGSIDRKFVIHRNDSWHDMWFCIAHKELCTTLRNDHTTDRIGLKQFYVQEFTLLQLGYWETWRDIALIVLFPDSAFIVGIHVYFLIQHRSYSLVKEYFEGSILTNVLLLFLSLEDNHEKVCGGKGEGRRRKGGGRRGKGEGDREKGEGGREKLRGRKERRKRKGEAGREKKKEEEEGRRWEGEEKGGRGRKKVGGRRERRKEKGGG